VLGGRLRIRATQGALVGPPWQKRENGYRLEEASTGLRLYYEPHADAVYDSVREVAPVDVMITPVTSQGVGYWLLQIPLVAGYTQLEPLMRILRPTVLVPLMNAEFTYGGLFSPIVAKLGTLEGLPGRMKRAGFDVQIAKPQDRLAETKTILVPARDEVEGTEVGHI
jgi:hypothetical protein